MPLSGPQRGEAIDIPGLLAKGLQQKPDETALASADRSWTWRELERVSRGYAASLLALGLRPGDRVASLMPNRDALLIHYLGCLRSGLVATPLNYRYMPPEIDHALEVSGAKVVLTHAERDGDIAASRLARRLPLGVISYGAKDGRSPSFEAMIEGRAGDGRLPTPAPADPAVIFFTSGSTGPAKGVTHSFETMGWVLACLMRGCEITATDIVLPGCSLSHIGGFIFSFMTLASAARVIVARTFDGHELLPLLRQQRPTVLVMLPAPLFGLVRDHGAVREDFASVRLCLSGGDKVPGQLEREFTALSGFPIDETFGMTEIGIATISPPSGLNKIGSVGRLIAGYQASIRDEMGTEMPAGAEGRLWIRSPCNTVGYWSNPEATAATIKDGWLDTGDVMKADADGYLWFCGRRKQIIVHDGSNIAPQEVEDALIEHPAVTGAGVVGIHDLVHGENVRAFVTLKDDVPRPTQQALIDFVRARVGYKAPEDIVVLDTMPLNPTGKVDRVALKKMAEERLSGGGTRDGGAIGRRGDEKGSPILLDPQARLQAPRPLR